MSGRHWRSMLAIVLAISLFAVACGGSDDDVVESADTTEPAEADEPAEPAEPEPEFEKEVGGDFLLRPENVPSDDQRGGVVVVGYAGAIPHTNGTVSSGYAVNSVGPQVNASLLRYNDDYQPVPYLADTWTIADDGLSVTLELNAEARFHDGEDVTCTDVDFSIKTSQANHPFKPMFAPVTGVDGGDTKSCVVNLSQPHPALLIAFSPGLLPIIPEHIFNDGQEMKTHPRNSTDVIGAGPFKLVEFDGSEVVRFEANDDFFLPGLPYLDELIFDLGLDPATVTLGLETGEFDIAAGDGAHGGQVVVDALEDPNLRVSDKGFEAIGSIPWIQLNLRDEVLSDVRVRQALAYAIDKEAYNDVIAVGLNNTAQCGPIQRNSPYYNPDGKCYDFDLEKAQALMDEAGYSDGFSLTMNQSQANVPTMELIAEMWAKIGVTVEISLDADFPDWIAKTVGEGTEFDATWTTLWNWGDPVIGVNRSYNCDNRVAGVAFSNMSWYCNEEVDSLLNDAGLEFDDAKRAELYYSAADIINEEVPVIYLSNQVWYTRMQKSLQNSPESIWGFMDSWAEMWVDA
jgi:peptide/nickel transport system substrate-binding protein